MPAPEKPWRSSASSSSERLAGFVPPPAALSVGELTAQVRALLEGAFGGLRVYGELIGLSRPSSGHLYFSLKDGGGEGAARLAAVMWRDRARRLRFALEDGMLVVVEGRLTVYEPRGAYQIVVEAIRPAGQGTLLVALERLKEKLFREGLFEPARKRPLPPMPRCIGVVSSASGAAVKDVLRSIYRKFPAWVRLFPVRVQGDGAADEIVAALARINAAPGPLEVVILARGGGSLEDLWTFNEEKVARAVAACRLPTVSGVGHEVDLTLVDLVADVRAQTPTHAGDLVVPDWTALVATLAECRLRTLRALGRSVREAWDDLVALGRRLRRASPQERVRRLEVEVAQLGGALKKGLYSRLRQWQDLLLRHGEKLDVLDPRRVFERGYSVTRTLQEQVVRRADEVRLGEELEILLHDGRLRVQVLRQAGLDV